MVIRISSMVLSLAGVLALILGLLFWAGSAVNLLSLHMLLGLLAVGALWIIGVAQAFLPSGSWMIAVVAIIVGGLMIILGLTQTSLMVGDFHWVVRTIHLLLGLLTVAIGTGPLGFVQIGLLAEAFGAQCAVLISGAEGLLAMALTRPLWRMIRASPA